MSSHVQSLVDRALAGLSPDQARDVADQVDAALASNALNHADRGQLLTARALAGQFFEPPEQSLIRLREAIPLLELAKDVDRLVRALTSATSFALLIGEVDECMEFAVRAMTLIESGMLDPVPTQAFGNLAVVFHEFSAFGLSTKLGLEALASLQDTPAGDVGTLVAFGLARAVIEAAWTGAKNVAELDDQLSVADHAIDFVRDSHGAEGLQAGARLVVALLESELALLRGDNALAERRARDAMDNVEAVPYFEGEACLVAGMSALRSGRFEQAIALLNRAEPLIPTAFHRLDRLRCDRADAFAALGDHESAFRNERQRSLAASTNRVRYMGAVIEQVRARAVAEQSRISLERTTESLTEQSRRDGLTGVASRGWFDACCERSESDGGTVAVLMLDLDRFKEINDRHSHQVGDAVLRRFGTLLTEAVSDDDIAARYGGEEFAVLIRNAEVAAAHAVAERLRKAVASEPWYVIAANLHVTVSAGVAAGPAARIDEVIGWADGALYAAKSRGRDRVVASEPSEHFS